LKILIALTAMFFAFNSFSKMITKEVRYKMGDTYYKSQLVFSDKVPTNAPLVLMVPNWRGMTEGSLTKAKKVAANKYIVMLADVYGENIRPKNNDEAKVAATKMRSDVPLLRKATNKAIDILKEEGKKLKANQENIAAIGFCFGGGAVLESARSGKKLKAVVSFHGNLNTPDPKDAKNIKASVLVLNGAIDPAVPKEQIADFEKEMNEAKVDWQFVNFSGAVHSFTNPEANHKGRSEYHPVAAKRSFTMMNNFFDEVFN